MLMYGRMEKVVKKKKEKRFHKRTISIVISNNHPTPFPLYHGGGMDIKCEVYVLAWKDRL